MNSVQVEGSSSFSMLYLKDKSLEAEILANLTGVTGMRAWKRSNVPSKYAFGSQFAYGKRIGDIVLESEIGWIIEPRKKGFTLNFFGGHGFDNHDPNMIATFLVKGKAIKKKGVHFQKAFENTNIYNMVLSVWNGTDPAANDGIIIIIIIN